MHAFFTTDSYSDIFCTVLAVNFIFCMQLRRQVPSGVAKINKIGLTASEPRLRQHAGMEKSQTPLERGIFFQG